MITWTASHQVSLSSISLNLIKLMSIESLMPSNYLIFSHPFLSCPQSFSASGSFPMSLPFTSGGHSIGASASASVLPINIKGLFLSGLTGFIPLVSKGLSGIFSSTVVGKNQFCGAQPSLQCNSIMTTGKTTVLPIQTKE